MAEGSKQTRRQKTADAELAQGQVAAMRAVLEIVNETVHPVGEDTHSRTCCDFCDGEQSRDNPYAVDHELDCSWTKIQNVLAAGCGKPEAAIIVGAQKASKACHERYAAFPTEKPCCNLCIWQECCEAAERLRTNKGG